MKKITLLFLCIFYLSVSNGQFCDELDVETTNTEIICPEIWRLVLYDDFTGITLNDDLWNMKLPNPAPSDECGFQEGEIEGHHYKVDNVEVYNSAVHLITKEESSNYSGTFQENLNNPPDQVGNIGDPFSYNLNYTSGIIVTDTSFVMGDGIKVEARMRIPGGYGMFPAFWLYGAGNGEIDFFEPGPAFNDQDEGESTIHNSGYKKLCRPVKYDLTRGVWHIWEAEANRHFISLKIDGQEVLKYYRRYDFATGSPIDCGDHTSKNQLIIAEKAYPGFGNFRLIFNTAIYVNTGQQQDAQGLPGEYEIDYVKIFQGCPLTPKPITINNITDNSLDVTWDATTGFNYYDILWKDVNSSNSGSEISINGSGDDIVATVTGLDPMTEYTIQVIPHGNNDGCDYYVLENVMTSCSDLGMCDPCYPKIDKTISVDMTLDEYQISGDLIVQNGATLTIDQDVEFTETSSLVIKSGSKVIVDGAILTNCPNSGNWNGVDLAGHFSIGFFPTPAGTIEMINGAKIENAKIAIDCSNVTNLGGITVEYGGGIITMNDAYISQCEIGINFAPYGWSSFLGNNTVEQSLIYKSTISNCGFAIKLERSIGVRLEESVFYENDIDVEAFTSSINALRCTFHSDLKLYSDYPNFQGANFTSNNFINAFLLIQTQGNSVPFIFEKNSLFNAGFWVYGELEFLQQNNDYYDSNIANVFWETGDNLFNFVRDNAFYNNEYANTNWGLNDMEYLTNCFEGTDELDIELYNGASIHETQGLDELSAGNCFEFYARIGTGTGTESFDYWTKDGFNNSTSCKNPGGAGNFTKRESQFEGNTDDCGTGFSYTGNLPTHYQDCKCDHGDYACKNTIDALETEIEDLENNTTINFWVKKWLIAKYKRCLDRLKKDYVKKLLSDDREAEAITYLSEEEDFRYRVMAYMILNNKRAYTESRTYLNNMQVSNDVESDFVQVQHIYLDYINDITGYELSTTEQSFLLLAGQKKNPLSGYARSIYYRLTGENISIDLPHINGSSTTRSSTKPPNIEIYPNPIIDSYLYISLSDLELESSYQVEVYNNIGSKINSIKLLQSHNEIVLEDVKGILFLKIVKDGNTIHTQKVVNL